MMEAGAVRPADETIAQNEYDASTVSVMYATSGTSDATVLGSGRYVRGDAVKLATSAPDNERFIGWFYSDGGLISANSFLEFVAKEDYMVTARFAPIVVLTTGVRNVTIDGNEATVKVETPSKGETLFFASYTADGRMLNIASQSMVAGRQSYTFELPKNVERVSAFILSGEGTPSCQNMSASIEAQ